MIPDKSSQLKEINKQGQKYTVCIGLTIALYVISYYLIYFILLDVFKFDPEKLNGNMYTESMRFAVIYFFVLVFILIPLTIYFIYKRTKVAKMKKLILRQERSN